MAKKKILVVQMSLHTGGTTSSLKALMQTSFSKENDIDILAICNNENNKDSILKQYIVNSDNIAQLWYSSTSQATRMQKLAMLPFKIIKRIPIISDKINIAIAKHIARKAEKREHYDTVIAYSEYMTPDIVQHFKTPNKIAWIHCDYGNRITREEEHIFNKFNTIVCVSDYTCNSFIKRYPSLKNKVTSIYNICSIDSIKAKSKEDINDNQFDTSVFTIISIGRIATVKRFHKIPEIAKRLKDTGCTFKWYIMGGGSAEDTDKIKTAIESNGVSGEVIMLGARSNPYPYIKRANLLVSTSESEACPMIFNEAKILGIPIVSSNFGSSYEFIKQGTDGYITSIEEMHKVIEKLITDKTEYSKLAPVADKELLEETIIAKINNII